MVMLKSNKKYYENLYWQNKLNLAWIQLKRRKTKRNLQEFLMYYRGGENQSNKAKSDY